MAQIQIKDLERPVQELKYKEMKGIFGGFTNYTVQTLSPTTLCAPLESTLATSMNKLEINYNMDKW